MLRIDIHGNYKMELRFIDSAALLCYDQVVKRQVKKSVDNFIGKYFISSSRLSPAVGGWRNWLVSPLRSLTTSSSPYRQPYGL